MKTPSKRLAGGILVAAACLLPAVALGFWQQQEIEPAANPEFRAKNPTTAQQSAGEPIEVLIDVKKKYQHVQAAIQKQAQGKVDPDQLRSLVYESFQLRQQLQRLEIDALRARLSRLEERLASREKTISQLVEERVLQLQTQTSGPKKASSSSRYYSESENVALPVLKSGRNSTTQRLSVAATGDAIILYKPDELRQRIQKTAGKYTQAMRRALPEARQYKSDYEFVLAEFASQMRLLETRMNTISEEMQHAKKELDRISRLRKSGLISESEKEEGEQRQRELESQLVTVSELLRLYKLAGEHESPEKAAKRNVGRIDGFNHSNNRTEFSLTSAIATDIKGPVTVAITLDGEELVTGRVSDGNRDSIIAERVPRDTLQKLSENIRSLRIKYVPQTVTTLTGEQILIGGKAKKESGSETTDAPVDEFESAPDTESDR